MVIVVKHASIHLWSSWSHLACLVRSTKAYVILKCVLSLRLSYTFTHLIFRLIKKQFPKDTKSSKDLLHVIYVSNMSSSVVTELLDVPKDFLRFDLVRSFQNVIAHILADVNRQRR